MLSAVESRQQQILNYLKTNQFSSVSDLMALVNYSEATIKRDLIELEQSGLLRRTRGGAMWIDNKKIDVPYLMKITHLEEDKSKQYVADVAKTLVRDDMVLFVDSSTTCLHLVKTLAQFEGLQIITNGILTAAMLNEFTSAHVAVLGGSLVHKRATINGAKAYQDILTYNADLAFVGTRGFDFKHGLTETHEGEALIKKGFRLQAKKLAVLATHDKFDHKFMYQSIACHEIDYLITDNPIDENQMDALDIHEIQWIY